MPVFTIHKLNYHYFEVGGGEKEVIPQKYLPN